ncbi:hypothetical protein [Deinococcus soli (ex Cha et al. 2016)]|uniref:Orotidine-5'-phosphate decarboxylase n=2 Tax=Deinococcus soli (ex Cha et al. 2016) TaxID=1309411 RepID=A0ACC6KFB2_9DEIO|nr:hypothetical protein [Deinococcus soli (ex Cha et al. 2016)]MDR6218237.1 orotidine-5'-phosphate decarboxylase [Deinococcus soli (ex Cha et al. 2016)]MDR6328977.1 orotidine-5'-phosphate decarboxylase [Deinococcus soli (ex Cha et al. 2016)]MDR6751250.1 orotidine-5'-phosphate decarboxylase [Deinococcus soli (ex Cha et al. 2016)]
MGEINRQTLIINSDVRASAERVHAEARARTLNVSPILQSAPYANFTVAVLPSGSKYGWAADQQYMQRVHDLIDWLAERRSDPGEDYVVCEYALVNFGEGMAAEQSINLPPHVMRHSGAGHDEA